MSIYFKDNNIIEALGRVKKGNTDIHRVCRNNNIVWDYNHATTSPFYIINNSTETEYISFQGPYFDSSTNEDKYFYYKIGDTGSWTARAVQEEGYCFVSDVAPGEKVYIKAFALNDSQPIHFYFMDYPYEAHGDVTCLVNGSGLVKNLTVSFEGLFKGTGITVAPEFPCETIPNKGYYQAFSGCTSLTAMPELHLTEVPLEGCSEMFYGCTSLATATDLSALTVKPGGYTNMFSGCTALQTPPAIAATTAEYSASASIYGCMQEMFSGCTHLTIMPELHVTTVTTRCYQYMFSGCTQLATATNLDATDLDMACYYGMFYKCINLKTPPALPASTMKDYCYASMFSNSGIESMPALNATTLATSCYANMFYECNGITTASSLPATKAYDYCYNGMFYGTSLQAMPNIAITELAKGCFKGMFEKCTKLVTVQALPVMDLTESCYQEMFFGCSLLSSFPELPATISAKNCYNGMFKCCNLLTSAPEIKLESVVEGSCSQMFYQCEALVNMPVLHATTVGSNGFSETFYSCIRLKNNVDLPFTTLESDSINLMFYNCSVLDYIKVAFTSWPSDGNNWVQGVAATGTFEMGDYLPEIYDTSHIPVDWTLADKYLYFIADAGADLTVEDAFTYYETSTDNTNWVDVTTGTYTLNAGEPRYFRNKGYDTANIKFGSTGTVPIKCKGRISVLGTTDNLTAHGMFKDFTSLIEAPKLDICWNGATLVSMFENCTNLANSPVIGQTSDLVTPNYTNMFKGCTSLTSMCDMDFSKGTFVSMYEGCTGITAAIPFTRRSGDTSTIYNQDYTRMFAGCTGLLTPPTLPCIHRQCNFKEMFDGCTNLTATLDGNQIYDTDVDSSFEGTYEGCEALTTTGILPLKVFKDTESGSAVRHDLTTSNYKNMFKGCTNLTDVPAEFVAENVNPSIYFGMFMNCKSLVNPPTLNLTLVGTVDAGISLFESMFEGCESLQTTMLPSGQSVTSYDINSTRSQARMYAGCINLTNIDGDYANQTEECCEKYEGCTSLTNVTIPCQSRFLGTNSYARAFKGCTGLLTVVLQGPGYAMQISAGEGAWAELFSGCTSLNNITTPQINWDYYGTEFMTDWVLNVAASGDFNCSAGLTTLYDTSHIPVGWTVKHVL